MPVTSENIPVTNQTNGDDATTEKADKESNEFWVFGYGSLVWKVDFPICTSQKGFIKGYHRRFYQHSIDHRGTPEQPGRVVTLQQAEDDTDARVFGIAYQIADQDRDAVISHLDHREKNGYVRKVVDFYPYSCQSTMDMGLETVRRISIYVATADNESFAGHKDIPELADQIFHAVGPSGSNMEYVLKLADAMRTNFPGQEDDHLFDLERALIRRAQL